MGLQLCVFTSGPTLFLANVIAVENIFFGFAGGLFHCMRMPFEGRVDSGLLRIFLNYTVHLG